MYEMLQNLEVMADRFKDRLNGITNQMCGRVSFRSESGIEFIYDETTKGILTITLTNDKHSPVSDLVEDEEVVGRRKLAVELVKSNIGENETCVMNVGYTPGNTFYRGTKNIEIDLVTKKVYNLVDGERKKMDEWSENTFNIGLEVLESHDLRLISGSFLNQNYQNFKASRIN